jgi:hypothetical protein
MYFLLFSSNVPSRWSPNYEKYYNRTLGKEYEIKSKNIEDKIGDA